MQKTRVKYLSTVVMVGLAVFLLYYPYRVFNGIVPFAFIDPQLWETHDLAEKGVTIPFGVRLAYLCMWMLPVLATMAMTCIAMHFFNLLRQGVYFDARVVRDVQGLGISAVVAGVGITVAYSIADWLITLMNVTQKRGVQFGYDPAEIGLILSGLGMFIAGWVVKVVVLQDQENKGFV